MERKEFLPIGTVVVLKGGARRKAMIITRALATTITKEITFFDYGGCFYPIGLVGDQILYFNEEDIEEVAFKGYVDEDELKQQEEINKWLIEHDMKKGNVKDVMDMRKKLHEEAAERARNMPKPQDMLKNPLEQKKD